MSGQWLQQGLRLLKSLLQHPPSNKTASTFTQVQRRPQNVQGAHLPSMLFLPGPRGWNPKVTLQRLPQK